MEEPNIPEVVLLAYIEKIGPEESFDRNLVQGVVYEMDQYYRQNEQFRADLTPWVEPSLSVELFRVSVSAVKELQLLDKLPQGIFWYTDKDSISSAARDAIQDFGEAYMRLMQREDPDGWLLKFMEKNHGFKRHIGGVPSWLAEAHQIPDWWGVINNYYECVAISNERYGKITPFLSGVFEWIQWLYEEGLVYTDEEIRGAAKRYMDLEDEDDLEKLFGQLAEGNPGKITDR